MTLVLRYAVRSDVGLLREGNEDSAYAGPRLLAVADGMGGHAAGEVASSLTISSMAKLDSEPPGGDMMSELAAACWFRCSGLRACERFFTSRSGRPRPQKLRRGWPR